MAANKVMMLNAIGVKSCSTAFRGDFAHQTSLHQVTKIVVRRGSRRPRIYAIHCLKNFSSRWMAMLFHQERHNGKALRSAPQPTVVQRPFNYFSVHELIRLYLT